MSDARAADSPEAVDDDGSAEPEPIYHKRLELFFAPGAVRLQWENEELSGFSGAAWEPGFKHRTLDSDEYPLYWQPVRRGVWLDWSFAGFEALGAEAGTRPPGRDPSGVWLSAWAVTLPLWSVTLATAVGPLWWTRTRLRCRRERPCGRCPVCGYDMRATPDRCPECGDTPGGVTP